MSLFDNTFAPIGLSIQRGNVGNFSGVHKFGLNIATDRDWETNSFLFLSRLIFFDSL